MGLAPTFPVTLTPDGAPAAVLAEALVVAPVVAPGVAPLSEPHAAANKINGTAASTA
ncbi:hypothetical protein ACFQ0B_36415 [Nonomuraea thailandensis]